VTGPSSALTEALHDRYDLGRELGRGGMATVYLAQDRRHGRPVAIKVLRPDLAASIGSERFLKEIEIAARLTHPHILALYDSGRADLGAAGELLYYVMPYVDGGSLRQRLVELRRLAPADALRIAEPVADALGYAHRNGIFHRDIKPENILFSQGHPIVADFGIAKAISTAAGGGHLTRTGFPLGTPGYMSPEQAAGLTDLDERTDVYSLAVTIYEMIAGEIPGRWPTEEEVRAGRFLSASASHRARLAAAGEAVEGALVRGLAVRHEQRTASPAALFGELCAGSPASPGAIAPRRRYSGDEVEEIVKRASELEAARPTDAGMTIGGVEALAREVAIPTEAVREAARSLRRTDSPAVPEPIEPMRRNLWVNGPTTIAFERVVEGEVPEAEFPMLVDEIRRVLNLPGQASQFGRSFAWSASRGHEMRRDLEVSVSVRAGRTTIAARENLSRLVGGVFGGICGGLGGGGMGPVIGLVANGFHAIGPIVAAAIPFWLGGVYVGARTVYARIVRKRIRQLEALMDRLEAAAAEVAAGPATRPRVRPGTS
jgi:serine/threonine protein kinase